MQTLLVSHPDCLQHDPGAKHPESRGRLEAVLNALQTLSGYIEFKAPLASEVQISRVHPGEYCQSILASEPDHGLAQLDPDTFMSPGSSNAALRAAGAVCMAVEEVVGKRFRNAFCAVRPPGHHAEPAVAMGFCLFNNVAIGAAHALTLSSVERVAIVDFDVHHGNGTQAIFSDTPKVTYISTHQRSLYPWTGHPEETGAANIYNLPLKPNSGSREFRHVVEQKMLPILRQVRPDLLMISAGFDAHEDDPLAQLNLKSQDYYWVTQQLCELAAESCAGRIVSTLEGGYNLPALAESAKLHMQALIEASRNIG